MVDYTLMGVISDDVHEMVVVDSRVSGMSCHASRSARAAQTLGQ